MSHDYLIVGAGWYGAVIARELTDLGYRCLVLDRNPHVAGHSYTEDREGIQVHKYGPHIFHTSNERVWNYVQRFATFLNFINSPLARYQGKDYSLPFNMNTYQQLWGVSTPEQAKERMARLPLQGQAANLEEQALSMVGREIFEKLIKGYSEKQWMTPCNELPAAIIRRIPVRFTWDDSYFKDPYQGIPAGGYTRLFERMLEGIEVELNVDYLQDRAYWNAMAPKVIFTGPIDEFFGYRFGELAYRTLRFEETLYEQPDYQGNAVYNHTGLDVPYTREVEHKHFEFGQQEVTVVTREYPETWFPGRTPYYPVKDAASEKLYQQYRELAQQQDTVLFGGRLGKYRYYDMDQVTAAALKTARDLDKEHRD